LTGLVSKISDF